jgi:oligopeptide transport system substrate-binding protein
MIKQTFIFLGFIAAWLLLANCGQRVKQFEHAGGSFSLAISHEPTTFIARDVSDLYSAIVLQQILEGLVSLCPNKLEPIGAIAESWEVLDEGRTFKFKIKDNIFFHEHELIGSTRRLTPEDVKYSIELACKKEMGRESSNAYKAIYKNTLLGADEFHNGAADHIEGIEISDNFITLKLVRRDVSFVDKLTQATALVVCKELVEAGKEAELIGTGPFRFDRFFDGENNLQIILTKNGNYHMKDKEGNQLPYLDSLVYIVESKSLEQLELFEAGKIQVIEGLPPSRITSLLEAKMEDFNSTPPRLIMRRKPLIATQYYHFNLNNETFKDPRVRKAINYAVDRNDIVQNVLNNQAYAPGNAGIIPPKAFSGYKSSQVAEMAYNFDPGKAQKLLAEAGYPNGEGFPPINLKFNIGTIHSGVADRFAKHMQKYLNIRVNLDGMSFEDKLRDQENANGDIFRTSWFADYYSPETFLMNAYGKTVPQDPNQPSFVNHSRYKNAKFDELFEAGQATDDLVERYAYFVEAEKILMEDAPFIILWYEETIKIADANVRNLVLNEMNFYSFKEVYIKEWTKEEYEASVQTAESE